MWRAWLRSGRGKPGREGGRQQRRLEQVAHHVLCNGRDLYLSSLQHALCSLVVECAVASRKQWHATLDALLWHPASSALSLTYVAWLCKQVACREAQGQTKLVALLIKVGVHRAACRACRTTSGGSAGMCAPRRDHHSADASWPARGCTNVMALWITACCALGIPCHTLEQSKCMHVH